MSRKYGLIGKSLVHSFSKKYFTDKFRSEGLSDCKYENYEIMNTAEISRFLESTSCLGLNVTIPYKEDIIAYLDELDENSKAIGAVNTIKLYPDGRKKGFNTDFIGFLEDIQDWPIDRSKHALILGGGGASKAIDYALQGLGIKTKMVSRSATSNKISYDSLDKATIKDSQLIINCSPLGTHPNTSEFPPIPYHYLDQSHLVYDLVYNPSRTTFMQKAEQSGAKSRNGYGMLIKQAEEAWKIWNEPTI